MIVANRSLAVTTDGELLAFSGRIRLRGQDELSLFPALFTMELWNLPEESALRISRCRSITVSHEDACLVSGAVSDVYRHATPEGILTSVSISLGLNLWESVVSLHVPAGTTVSDTVRAILTASGTGIQLLSFPETDPISIRGQSFFGRAAESITSVLSATSIGATAHRADRLFRLTSAPSRYPPLAVDGSSPAVNSRPMLTPSGLKVVPASGLPNAVRVTEKDLLDTPVFPSGGSLMILSCTVAGWRPGQTVEVSYKNIHARGIVVAHSVDADTGSGVWKCEMMCEVLP